MKKLRIIFIILILFWMGTVFYFSNQPTKKTQKTSSNVTKVIVKIFYGETEKFEENVNKLDPIIRKLAHYTLYFIRWCPNSICSMYI